MLYVCSHDIDNIPYVLHCPYEIIDNTKSNLPEDYRHLRGMLEILKRPLPDEIGIFQHRRFVEYEHIPEGYDIVVPKDFGNFNIYNQYCYHHHKEDLDLCEDIINEPEFSEWIRKNNNDEGYMHNLGIWKRLDYIGYCSFLFDVLAKYSNKRGDSRDVAFLAERLGAYWISKHISKEKRYVVKTITIS